MMMRVRRRRRTRRNDFALLPCINVKGRSWFYWSSIFHSQLTRAQLAIKPTLKTTFHEVMEKTGYVGVIVLSAPNPKHGGSIESAM